jgi:phenylacetic acid degradation operon negative regulatory protein
LRDRGGLPALEVGALGTLSRSLVADVAYFHVRLLGGFAPTAAWVALLHQLDIPPGTTRAAIRRLVRGGHLEAGRQGPDAGYRLTPAWLEAMAAADRSWEQLLAPPPPLSDGWVVVVFSIPEAERAARHQLRALLARMGFGNVGPATWLAPAWRAEAARTLIPLLGAPGEIDLFTGTHLGLGTPADLVRRAWDLDGLARAYDRVVHDCERLLARDWRFPGMEREAFVGITRFASAFRHLLQDDPGLPVEVAPHGWAGWRARRLVAELADALHERALDHVEETLGGAAGAGRLASPFGSGTREAASRGA